MGTNSLTRVGAKDMPDQTTGYIEAFACNLPAVHLRLFAKRLGIAGKIALFA
jgi:hypothetical protein